MVRLEKHGDSAVRFIFTDSDHYLYKDGVVDVPVNSLSLVIDESEMVTFKKASTADPFISFRLDKSNFSSRDELLTFYKENMVGAGGISEEEVQEMIDAATSGIPSSEVVEQLRRDVNAVSGEVDTKQDILTAGENITISGNVISADAGNNIIELTQAEYDALETKDPEALYIITDAQEINMNDYYTKSEVDASINTKADASALTAVNNALTAHTANTEVHVTQAEKNTWNGKVDEGYVTDYAYSKNQIDGFLENATTLLQTISGEVDTKVDTTTYESGQYATAQALNALQENKLDASAYTPTDLSQYWTSGQTQEAINAATSGIPSSQVIEALRSDLNTVSGNVENKQDALEYYGESEFPNGGGRGMINVYNGKTYNTNISARASYTDGGTYASLYAKGEAGSNTLKVSPDGVTINDAKVLTENDIDVNEVWETIDEKEEVIASALTKLNQDVSDIDAKEEVIASALTEVRQDKQDALEYYSETSNSSDDGEGNVSTYHESRIDVGQDNASAVISTYYQYNEADGDVEEIANVDIYAGYDDPDTDAHKQSIIHVGNEGIRLTNARDVDDGEGGINQEYTEVNITKDGMDINGDAVATEPYVDAALSGKADTSAVTAVNGALTAHTADTTVHVTSAEKDAWNAKADASAITSIESAVTNVQSAVTAVSNDLNTLSGAVIDNEYTVSQAINSLNNRVTAVESGGTGGGITSGEVQTMIDDSLDIYWTSAQTQTAIDGAKAYYIDFATIMTQGIHDADWDGIVNAINAHRPIYAGLGGRYYTAECLTQDGGNKIIMTASDELNHYFYTFTKNGSENYSFSYETRPYVTDAEKNTWNTKQDGLVSGTNIKTINNESILGSGNISLQEKLVSGTNIKTVNNQSILGTGNIDIQSGSSVTVDSALNSESTNPVQNKAIAANILDHYESANDIIGNPRYLKAITKSGGLSRPLSLYFSTINNKDIFANNGNGIVPTVNTFSLVETSAITTSLTSSSTDAQVPSAKTVYDQFGGLKLVKLTQAQYDALSTKDAQTLYIVVD